MYLACKIFFIYLSKKSFKQVHVHSTAYIVHTHACLVQQRFLGKEIWLFKSEFTSVDATALSVMWGFVVFFSFFLFSSE